MTEDRWSILKEYFEAVMERVPYERRAHATRLCAGDIELYAQLDRLLTHNEVLEGFLDHPVVGPRTFSEGELVAGRFRITGYLGEGGMGEVYAAEDTTLAGTIALKTLRREITGDPRNLERLLREVKLARMVTHPNVCRVFDLERHPGAHGEVVFLTMERVLGETLAAALVRGPLSPGRASGVAQQIADAVDAAHQAGVIHRDLKPSNVMLADTPSGELRVVVMDFGLARKTEATAHTGPLIGTPAYMAPELIAGGEPSPASDIYSFGVLLHEIAAGRKPGVTGLSDTLDERWRKTIERCLARNPSLRFSRIREVIDALQGPKSRQLPGLPTRAAWIALCGLAAALALIWSGFRVYDRQPVFAQGAVLLVADMDNATGDPSLDAATAVLRSQLEQSGRLRLWSRNRAPAVLAAMGRTSEEPISGRTAREVALREDVPFVLFASLSPLADGINLTLGLEQLDGTSIFKRRAWRFSTQATDRAQVHDAIHEASLWVRRTIGEGSRELAAHDRLPQETTTVSWEALLSYSIAEKFQNQGNSDAAVQVLKDAIRLDSHFALAYMRLGDILMANSQQDDGLRYWAAAVTESNRQRLTRHELLRIQGLYAGDTWDWDGYAAAFAQMESEYPYDYLASFYLGSALRLTGHYEDAARKFEAAASKTHDSLAIADNLGSTYLALGDLGRLKKAQDDLVRLGRRDVSDTLGGANLFAAGDFPGALAAFQQVKRSASAATRSRAIWFVAATLAEMGRSRAAESALEEGIELDRKAALYDQLSAKEIALAWMHLRRSDLPGSRLHAFAGVTEARGPSQVIQAAIVLAGAGSTAKANELLARIDATVPGTKMAAIASHRVHGEEFLAQGNGCAAVEELEGWNSMDSQLRPREALARALASCGRTEEALGVFQRSREMRRTIYAGPMTLFPGMFTDTLLGEAECALRLGRTEPARTILRASLQAHSGGEADDPARIRTQRLLSQIPKGKEALQ